MRGKRGCALEQDPLLRTLCESEHAAQVRSGDIGKLLRVDFSKAVPVDATTSNYQVLRQLAEDIVDILDV